MTPGAWIAPAAVLALLLGLVLIWRAGMRRRRGLGGGKTVSLDKGDAHFAPVRAD